MGNQASKRNDSLTELIESKNEDMALQVILEGANITTLSPEGISPLRLSLQNNLPQVFRVLWKLQAPFTPPLSNCQTPLHHAVAHNNYQIAWMMLREHSVFPSFKNLQDAHGNSPLHYAVATNNSDMVALLLKYNASHSISNSEGKTPYDLALESTSCLADEIIEQFTLEDCMTKEKFNEDISPIREQGSTQGTTCEAAGDPRQSFLEKALIESRVPIINGNELEFLETMNRGSSCLVFRGMWRGSEIAIKQFKVEYSQSEKELQKFVKEMQILAQVRHPNLLLLMGICIDLTNLCLITEYVPNFSLFYALHKNKTRRLTLSERFSIAIQIAKGLAYLHWNDPPIVHRDLKPENCLLDHSMNLKIADFGLARPLTAFCKEAEMTTICIGTTRFMAPELFDKDKADRIGTEVDIWAFGCLIIELFSGKRPWHYISSSKASCICYEIFNRKPVPIPETIPPEVKEIVSQCCRYDPTRRPSINQVLEALELAKGTYVFA